MCICNKWRPGWYIVFCPLSPVSEIFWSATVKKAKGRVHFWLVGAVRHRQGLGHHPSPYSHLWPATIHNRSFFNCLHFTLVTPFYSFLTLLLIVVPDISSGNNSNTYTQDDIYSAVIFGASYARVHFGHVDESRSAPGGRQLVGQAANLTFESAVGCYRPNIRPSPCIITQP